MDEFSDKEVVIKGKAKVFVRLNEQLLKQYSLLWSVISLSIPFIVDEIEKETIP